MVRWTSHESLSLLKSITNNITVRRTTRVSVERITNRLTGNVVWPTEKRVLARAWAAVARPLAPAATHQLTALRDGKISYESPQHSERQLLTIHPLQQSEELRKSVYNG
jgi:hypothetical protein